MPTKCKTCSHPDRVNIDRELVSRWRTSGSFRNIAQRYGLHYRSIYRHFCEHIAPAIWEAEERRKGRTVEGIVRIIHEEIHEVRRLRKACTRWLQDPDDPNQLTVDPRADDVRVVYYDPSELDLSGKPVKRHEDLNRILARMADSELLPVSWTVKHPDPASTLTKAASSLEGLAGLFLRKEGALIDRLQVGANESRTKVLAEKLIQLIPRSRRAEVEQLIEEAFPDDGDSDG